MVHQENGEHSDKPYLNETTTPVTTVEFLQLLQSTISHPSTKGATMNPNNLVAACSNCNYSKGNRTEEQYIKDRNNKARRQVMKNKHKTYPIF
jgi:hypothetical protein